MPVSMARVLLVFCFFLLAVEKISADGILYPQDSETRQLINLDGLWNFRAADRTNQNQGFEEEWYTMPLKQVIPS